MVEDTSILEDYMKKGLEKGFNINYIKNTLIQHGHSPKKVETAANNLGGLRYPEKLKPHFEEAGLAKKGSKSSVILTIILVALIVSLAFITTNYFVNKSKVQKAESKLDEIKQLGVNIDDLSATMKNQLNLLKEKDLSIEEKQKIIEEQIKTIEDINTKIESQRKKVNELLLDIMNRMIGRMSE